MSGQDNSKWCILRTSPGRTGPLARSLLAAGFEAWTPMAQQSRRRPRSKVMIEFEAPILPTFVFVRQCHIPDLAECLALPVNPHPLFSIFHHCGRLPLIDDEDIANLRAYEDHRRRAVDRSRRKAERRTFDIGQSVRLEDGSFAGMSGVVKRTDGKFVLVDFGGTYLAKIATFLLCSDVIGNDPAPTGTAAQAA